MAEIADRDKVEKIKQAKEIYERWKSIKEAMAGYQDDLKEFVKVAAGCLECKPAVISRIFGKLYKDKKAEVYEDVAILESLTGTAPRMIDEAEAEEDDFFDESENEE